MTKTKTIGKVELDKDVDDGGLYFMLHSKKRFMKCYIEYDEEGEGKDEWTLRVNDHIIAKW